MSDKNENGNGHSPQQLSTSRWHWAGHRNRRPLLRWNCLAPFNEYLDFFNFLLWYVRKQYIQWKSCPTSTWTGPTTRPRSPTLPGPPAIIDSACRTTTTQCYSEERHYCGSGQRSIWHLMHFTFGSHQESFTLADTPGWGGGWGWSRGSWHHVP